MSRPERYVEYLETLAQRTDAIRTAAERGDWDAMLATLEERQNLMAALDRLPTGARYLTGEERLRATRILEYLVEQDQQVTQRINAAMAGTRTSIEENGLARATLSAYRKTALKDPSALPSRFMDKQK